MQGPRPVSPVLSGLVGESHHTDPRHVTFTLADAEGYGFCFACAWEVLLDSKQLTIRKRTIALEMLKVLSSMDEASGFLSTHGLASTSLAFCAQVLGVADDALARTVLELAALLQSQTSDKSACIDSIRFQLQTLTWKQARYVLVLLGRLVCDSSIAEFLMQSYGPLIEHLLGALSYPDEDARTTCTFVLLNLASVDSARERLVGLCGARLVCSVVELLSKSQSDGVHTNAIALLHALAAGAGVEIVRGSSAVERGHLVKALKPRLLSSHEPLRALTMQVIARVCIGSPETVAFYLDEGIADFVIEASCKASGLVLSSSIAVLTLFSDHPSFGSYVQFGFDALIEVLYEAIERLPQEGFRLLLKVLASCSSKLKSESLAIVANCINRGICREEPDVGPLACLVLAELIDCASITKREDVQPVTLACLEVAVDRLRACTTDSMDQHYMHAVLYVTAKCIPSPAYEPSAKQLFQLFVEKMLPLILAKWDQLSTHALLAMVLRLLLLATPYHLDRVKALMGVSAFTIALSLRSRVQGEPTIVALADQFLLALVLSATNTAAPSALEEIYRRSVPRLPENVEAMSALMTESRDLELQLTVLALFYSAVHAGDRVVDVERIDPALQSFFRSHPDLDQIPPDAFHVLTFLVSVAQSRAHELMSENGRTLTRAILSTCYQMARKPPVTVIKWLWQNPELRDYNRNQMLLWISDTSNASYTLAEWVNIILDDSNGAAVVMDMVASCDELSTKGLHLIQACLGRSSDATGLFASLGLMSALERLMTFRAIEWSPASLSAAALCTLQHLRHAHHSAPLTSPLHVVALLAREASRRQLPDELLLMIINAGNMIIILAGRKPDSEALVCSVAQAEKLIEIVCTSLAATSTSLSGGIVTVAALTFWTQLVPKLALVHGTRWQDSKTLERLLCAASMATFKQHLRGPSLLLRLLASHGLSAFLSLQGDASADRSTTSATYEEIRECIVLAQNNVQLAEEQTFKLASVACLSKLMAVEARMQAGGPPSTLPWNQFLTENIIASIPAAPLQLPDVHFLTMIVRHKPRWLPSVMGATTIEALLLKFACSVNIPLVMGYIDLLRELHTAGMITAALRPVASRVVQKQQKDIATTMRADAAMEQEESSKEVQLLWQEIDGVVVPQHMLWPGHSTTAEEAARQLHALVPLFAS